MELNSTDVTVVVTNLDPFNYYVFYVLAFTVASSDPSENDTAVTAEAGKICTYVCMYIMLLHILYITVLLFLLPHVYTYVIEVTTVYSCSCVCKWLQ